MGSLRGERLLLVTLIAHLEKRGLMIPFALISICVSLAVAKDGDHHGGHQVGPDFGGHILGHGGRHRGHGGGHHGGYNGVHDGFYHGGHHGGEHTAVHVEKGHHGHHGHHGYHGHHRHVNHYESPHYSYGYNVYGGTPYEARFDKSETRTADLTTGGYSVDLPDGRTQVVTYTVAGPAGYQAKVEYFPTASYHAHPH